MSETTQYTSRLLRLISYAWMSFGATYCAISFFVFRVSVSGILKLILSPWYWIVSVIALMAGWGILRLRWYGWYAFLFSNFLITYQNAVTLVYYSEAPHRTLIFFGILALQILTIWVVGKQIRVPYFFPRIRWWESDPRYKLSVQVKVLKPNHEVEGEIMDISLGGCFIKTHGYFASDDSVTLEFSLFDRAVKCSGNVVWKTESTVTHPKGIGVKFLPLDKETHSTLKHATQKLKKLARVYSQMTREKNWQEYLQREQRYQGKKSSK